jgi:hypothetical protein
MYQISKYRQPVLQRALLYFIITFSILYAITPDDGYELAKTCRDIHLFGVNVKLGKSRVFVGPLNQATRIGEALGHMGRRRNTHKLLVGNKHCRRW